MTRDRTELWLPLLRELTDKHPGWAIWKNVDSAFEGTGDVDSFAPPEDWDAIQATFVEWARSNGLGPVLVCRHVPQGPHFITLQQDSPYLVQLDVKQRGTFRGSTLIDASTLLPLTEIDPSGFRRIRPGAEAVIKLCMNGIRKGGLPNDEGLRTKNVAKLLASDVDGVLSASHLLGPARLALLRGATALLKGGWDRPAMATVEAWCAARALAEPRVAASRWWFLNVVAKRCGVIDLIRDHDRRIEGDPAAWLRAIAADHELIHTS